MVLTASSGAGGASPFRGVLLNRMGARLQPWLAEGNRLTVADLDSVADVVVRRE